MIPYPLLIVNCNMFIWNNKDLVNVYKPTSPFLLCSTKIPYFRNFNHTTRSAHLHHRQDNRIGAPHLVCSATRISFDTCTALTLSYRWPGINSTKGHPVSMAPNVVGSQIASARRLLFRVWGQRLHPHTLRESRPVPEEGFPRVLPIFVDQETRYNRVLQQKTTTEDICTTIICPHCKLLTPPISFVLGNTLRWVKDLTGENFNFKLIISKRDWKN